MKDKPDIVRRSWTKQTSFHFSLNANSMAYFRAILNRILSPYSRKFYTLSRAWRHKPIENNNVFPVLPSYPCLETHAFYYWIFDLWTISKSQDLGELWGLTSIVENFLVGISPIQWLTWVFCINEKIPPTACQHSGRGGFNATHPTCVRKGDENWQHLCGRGSYSTKSDASGLVDRLQQWFIRFWAQRAFMCLICEPKSLIFSPSLSFNRQLSSLSAKSLPPVPDMQVNWCTCLLCSRCWYNSSNRSW